MKKWIVIIAAVIAAGAVGITALFVGNSPLEKKIEDYTLGEAEEILQQYFQEKGIELTPGTSGYLSYLRALSDDRLPIQEHPQIDLIKAYAAAYISEYQKTTGGKPSDRINQKQMEAFYKKTIGETLSA